MSSVSSKSGSSGQDDISIRAREEYKKKEAELVKKHNRELRSLTDRYAQDIEKREDTQTKLVSGTRQKQQEALTKRDLRYKQEIDELRGMHTKQLERLMQDNQDRIAIQAQTSKSEVEHANLGKNDRVNALNDRYDRQMAEESEKFANALSDMREEQKKTIQESRESMRETHDKELGYTQKERNEKVSHLQNEYRRLQQSSSDRLKNQEIRHMQNKNRMESTHMNDMREKEEIHNEVQDLSREAFNVGLKDLREGMEQARENDLEQQQEIFGGFKSDVNDRQQGTINRLEQDIHHAREQNSMDRTKAQRQAKLEVGGMRNAYQAKFNQLEKARLDTLRQSNAINAQDVRKIRGDADKQMAENSRYYIGRMEIENFKNRQAIDDIENFNAARGVTQKEANEIRFKSLENQSNTEEEKLRDYFATNVDVMKQNFNDEKKDLRFGLTKEKVESEQMMKGFMQKQEIEHTRESEDLRIKYEKRLADLNDSIMKEKRMRDSREKNLVKDLKRQHDTEIEALKIKHEEQNKQAMMSHDREMKDVSRRNQEKIDEVLNTIRKQQT